MSTTRSHRILVTVQLVLLAQRMLAMLVLVLTMLMMMMLLVALGH